MLVSFFSEWSVTRESQWVNRQPSIGLKSNRQKGYISPSTVKIADLIKRHLISGDLHKYQGILAKKKLLTVKLTSNILKNTLFRYYKALQKQTNKQTKNKALKLAYICKKRT